VEQSYGESRKKAISKISKPPKSTGSGPKGGGAESRGSPAGDAKSAPKIGKPKHGGSAPEPEILPTPMFRVPGLEDDTQTFKTEYRDDSLPPNIFGVDNFFGMSREEFEETVQMMNEPIPGCVHVQHPMIANRRKWSVAHQIIYGPAHVTRTFHMMCVDPNAFYSTSIPSRRASWRVAIARLPNRCAIDRMQCHCCIRSICPVHFQLMLQRHVDSQCLLKKGEEIAHRPTSRQTIVF
jgi:hypothetical protein